MAKTQNTEDFFMSALYYITSAASYKPVDPVTTTLNIINIALSAASGHDAYLLPHHAGYHYENVASLIGELMGDE